MPGELALSLANTLSNDRPGGDLLMNVRDLRDWLSRNELSMKVASASELQRFRDLRAVVRDLFAKRAIRSRPSARTLAAINAWAKSRGAAIRIIAGATSGGAALVTKPSITTPAQLKGKTIASPQLGNTQDVALRSWLKTQGYTTTQEGGGDVKVKPQPNAITIDTYKAGQIDGAWVPEPFASRLVVESGARVLVNEASLWPDGKFVTTHVIVRTGFLKKHPDVVENFLRGHVEAIEYANANPDEAQTVVNTALENLTGKPLKPDTIKAAWKNLTFTVDPISSSLHESAKHAEDIGLLDPVDLKGIYELGPLNKVLGDLGKSTVTAT